MLLKQQLQERCARLVNTNVQKYFGPHVDATTRSTGSCPEADQPGSSLFQTIGAMGRAGKLAGFDRLTEHASRVVARQMHSPNTRMWSA